MGHAPTESDLVHLVYPREYGYIPNGRMSDGHLSDDRKADRRQLDEQVWSGPTGRRPAARFMMWGSHVLGRAVPEPADRAGAATAAAMRAGII